MANLIDSLKEKGRRLRIDSLKATTEAGSGHPSSSLSAADLVSVIFFHEMRFDPNDPASVLKITTIRFNAGGVSIDWIGKTNHVYRINRASAMSRDNYTTLTNGLPGLESFTTFTDTTATNRTAFYWIEVQ